MEKYVSIPGRFLGSQLASWRTKGKAQGGRQRSYHFGNALGAALLEREEGGEEVVSPPALPGAGHDGVVHGAGKQPRGIALPSLSLSGPLAGSATGFQRLLWLSSFSPCLVLPLPPFLPLPNKLCTP